MCMSEPSIPDLDRLADLVRHDDPSLETINFAGDGRYQANDFSLQAVESAATASLSDGFRGRAAEDFPILHCAWGRARVGSTALNNLFGRAGLPSYYQPVKAVLRSVLTAGSPEPWAVPMTGAHPVIFAKETAGPYLPAECFYMPLRMLLEAGYPADRIHFLMMDREPEAALASWFANWSDRVPEPTLVKHFILATLNAARVRSYARRQGVMVTQYVHELSKEPSRAVGNLFARLDLFRHFGQNVITDWEDGPTLDSGATPICFPDEPTVYSVPGLHATGTAYRFRERAGTPQTEFYRALLARHGVDEAYEASVAACIADLGLDAATSRRLFGGQSDRSYSAA
jgi:hypothetical protein